MDQNKSDISFYISYIIGLLIVILLLGMYIAYNDYVRGPKIDQIYSYLDVNSTCENLP